MPEDRSVWEDIPEAMLLRRLFPRSVPNRVLHDPATGKLHSAAAETVSSSTVYDIVDQLMWVRYSQYEVEVGSVEEPVVARDLFRPRKLTDEENAACMASNFDKTYDKAWQRWRAAWRENVEFTPEQLQMKHKVSLNVFNRRSRSWFSTWIKKCVGDTHLAKGIFRFGYQSLEQVELLADAILETKRAETPPSAPMEESRACRRKALKAREQLRYARSISRRLENDASRWHTLASWQRDLMMSFSTGHLQAAVEEQNAVFKAMQPERQERLRAALDLMHRDVI